MKTFIYKHGMRVHLENGDVDIAKGGEAMEVSGCPDELIEWVKLGGNVIITFYSDIFNPEEDSGELNYFTAFCTIAPLDETFSGKVVASIMFGTSTIWFDFKEV